MSKRATYHGTVSGFSVDLETNKDLVNLQNVIDSDGDLVANEMDLFHGSWASNLEAGEHISFTAKLTSKVERQEIEGNFYTVRACHLCAPKIKK